MPTERNSIESETLKRIEHLVSSLLTNTINEEKTDFIICIRRCTEALEMISKDRVIIVKETFSSTMKSINITLVCWESHYWILRQPFISKSNKWSRQHYWFSSYLSHQSLTDFFLVVRLFIFFKLIIDYFDRSYFLAKPHCPIKKYKAGKYIVGDQLLVHEQFYDRVTPLEEVAKNCKVNLHIKGSYYQLANAAQQVLVSDADRVIGHGFQFELRDLQSAILCNKVCLSKSTFELFSFDVLDSIAHFLSRSNGYSRSQMFLTRCHQSWSYLVKIQ